MAQIISACAAIAAVIFVSYQISLLSTSLKANTLNSRQASARYIYLTYMNVAFANPNFIEPDYGNIKPQKEVLLKYKWFVLYLLWACDEILDVLNDQPWINACKYDMKKHLRLLCDEFYKDEIEQYYPDMQKLIVDEIKSAPTVQFPECSDPKFERHRP